MKKVKHDQTFNFLRERGWQPKLTEESYDTIASVEFHSKTLSLAIIAAEILVDEHPQTLRGLFYEMVGKWFPTTDKKYYRALGWIMTKLRERGVVPFQWIVDGIRNTDKPYSWSGLQDFIETVRRAYRKDFWSRLPEYVHVFCEKDARAGVLAPITREYDVALSVVRGYSGISFLHEIAEDWSRIAKPIFVYYLGDFDPSGLDLERDIKDKLSRYSGRSFHWERLAVNPSDFSTFNLYPLEPKKKDRRTQQFLSRGYKQCAELDAIPAKELRHRLEQTILSHIPTEEWERLQRIEELERERWQKTLDTLNGGAA